MEENEDDVFADDFKKLETKLEELHSNQPKEEKKEEIRKEITNRYGKKKLGMIGIIIIGAVIVVGIFASGLHEVIHNIINPIELGKSIDIPQVQENPVEEPKEDPFKGIATTTDKVEVSKTKEVLGYYLVTSEDNWYGDFVDFREIPNKIEKSGTQQVNFRCYTDEFLGTSTYFATFRNEVFPNLSVEVFINDVKVQEKSTDTNKALIVEGQC